MFKLITSFLTLIIFLLSYSSVLAKGSSFVSIVNPVRGADFWDQNSQQPLTSVLGQIKILKQHDVQATWLLRFDCLDDQKIIDSLRNLKNHQLGLFLEVTPTWTTNAQVEYQKSENWHAAGSAFLTGYEIKIREKLIDAAFDKFKQKFGYYPTSVGAWWIDAYSLDYMQKKYGITSSLIVSDQYTTDNYQIWGQYFSTPYYPSKNNALHPAQSKDSKLPVVIMQWGARDPLNAYGNGVYESTFSIQANDYRTFHNLDTNYFSKLIDLYTNNKQPFNKFGHIVVGLENSYDWQKYREEYTKQIETLVEKSKHGQFSIVTMEDFANWYKRQFPEISPGHIIVADDPLGSNKKVVWFMNPYYRSGWFFNQDGSLFRDIRQYIDSEEELCYKTSCNEVNFATFATRVLDEVSFGHKWIIDEGKITNFKVSKEDEKYIISYVNEAGKVRRITFLPRDIGIDEKIYSIDTAILQATKQDVIAKTKKESLSEHGGMKWSVGSLTSKTLKFILFLIFACIIPGLVLTRKILNEQPPFYQRIFLSTILGLVFLTLVFYLVSLLNFRLLIFIYLLVFLILFFYFRIFSEIKLSLVKIKIWPTSFVILVILAGTIFQIIPTFRTGLVYPYGIGLWGPNTHDGVWHIALINQLVKNVPPQNPIFANEVLKNYHFFYDLLIAGTNFLTKIDVSDLIFRFYPVSFSLMLGVGTYYLVMKLFKDTVFSLYLVYFAGSFGWIVEYLREKHLGGESAFWANQSISFNLNPPFAISLTLVIAIFLLLQNIKINKMVITILTILIGSLIAFKAYAGVLILTTLFLVGIFKKSPSYLVIFLTSTVLSSILFLSNFSFGKQLVLFAPFWFIHSMIDSPDRVGWVRLTLARTVGLEQGNWFKFITSEVISLILFILGNLGSRVFAIFSLTKIKSIYEETFHLSLFVFSSLALFIPIFFIQAGNPWNTIQFLYYFLYISAVVGGIAFAKVVRRINNLFSIPIILIFIIITPINSWATANGYLHNQPHALITNKELEALEFLKIKEDGVILTHPYDDKLKGKLSQPWPLFIYDSTAYVGALSEKTVFVEDEAQNQILLTDYKKRIIASKDFFKTASLNSLDKKFLEENNIKYIYLPKIFNLRISEENTGIKNIFENEEVIIYEVKS